MWQCIERDTLTKPQNGFMGDFICRAKENMQINISEKYAKNFYSPTVKSDLLPKRKINPQGLSL